MLMSTKDMMKKNILFLNSQQCTYKGNYIRLNHQERHIESVSYAQPAPDDHIAFTSNSFLSD